MSYALFMSDMHLDNSRPHITQLFIDYLAQHGPDADAVYLLGDLFEVWLGDKVSIPDYPAVIKALQTLVADGTAVFVMRGNRDFMLRQPFADATGATLLADPSVIDLYGTATLISHGDLLCTDDVPYQRFRKIVNNKMVQWLALHLIPDSRKRKIAADMRAASKRAQSDKPATVMDVNTNAVTQWFEQYGVRQMIHGHTHRPARHDYKLNGTTATRWVLGDWYTQGSVLKVSADSLPDLQTLQLS